MRLPPLASLLLCLSGLTFRLAAQTAPATAPEPTIEGAPLSSVAQSVLSTKESTYWAGQIFTINHKLTAQRRLNPQLDGNYEWNGGINTEDWGPAVMHEDENSTWFEQSTRGYTMKAGSLALPSGSQGIVLNTGVTSGSFVTQTKTGKFELHSTAPTLTIRPLPSPVPDNFTGAVGDFTLKASLSSDSVKVGDSVTWVMTLAGAGNWPEITSLPPRLISKEFDVVRPVIKKNLKDGSLFDGSLTEETLLVPNKPGSYQLGPLRFVYFDAKLGKYQMLTSETVTVTVTPAVPGSGGASAKTTGPREKVAVPDSPQVIPLAPLEGSDVGMTPFAQRRLLIPVMLPIVALGIFWFLLAAQRRMITDRLFKRRNARDRVVALVEQLDGANAPKGQALREKLFEWQSATAAFGGLKVSTPKAEQVAKAIAGHFKPEVGAAWARLWTESNQVIYGPNKTLPADWATRARAALQAAPIEEVPLSAAFYPRNLLPFLSLVLGLLALTPAHADPGADAYAKGSFSTAESLWRKDVTAHPKDAHAHYNLSLALAQQDRWSESAGEALSAFLLNPRDKAITWQFDLAIDRSGIDYPLYTGLVHGEGLYSVVRVLSPAGWEYVICLASVIFAVTGAAYLYRAYRGALSRGLSVLCGVVAVLSLLLAIAAGVSIRVYGPLSQRDIVFVSQPTLLQTVPNATDTLQKTAPLVAGSLAHTTRQFLGWTQVSFANGQTGWVRTDLLVPLYN